MTQNSLAKLSNLACSSIASSCWAVTGASGKDGRVVAVLASVQGGTSTSLMERLVKSSSSVTTIRSAMERWWTPLSSCSCCAQHNALLASMAHQQSLSAQGMQGSSPGFSAPPGLGASAWCRVFGSCKATLTAVPRAWGSSRMTSRLLYQE